jgi:flavin-binding protein dodecin
MSELSEELVAELIALLPPAPEAWEQAAIELPRAREAIDDLAVAAVADRNARVEILADLEAALRGAGVEPRPRLVETLRMRLSELE